MKNADRLLTLDAMRGIAAICVMVTHIKVDGLPHLVASGYLAVDFFFLLSGLVIAKTYDERLAAGQTLFNFVAVRAIRIYPLYLVGWGLGLAMCVGQILFNRPDQLTTANLAVTSTFEFFLLPSPVSGQLFVLDVPAWSLFFELFINVLYALLLVGLSTRILVILAFIFSALLIFSALQFGSLNIGQNWATFYGGFARVGFSFVVGMLIQRLHATPMRNSWRALLPVLALVGLLLIQADDFGRATYDLGVVLIAAPIVVWFGASYNPPAFLQRAAQKIGELSYPVYTIHYPIIFIFGFIAKKFNVSPEFWVPSYFLFVVVLAWILNEFWDMPIRKNLNSLLKSASSVKKPNFG